MNPTFSIITTTFNRGYVVWKAIQRAQKQVYPYFELLVVDDGSTDDTKKVVAEFQKDPRIKYFKIRHSGGASARNHGLKNAKGQIITYLDSDDYVYENFLLIAFEYFQKYPRKIFATCNYNRRLELYNKNYRLVDFTEASSAQKIIITLQDFYYWEVKTCGTGIFHKRKTIEDGIFWDPKFRMLDDLDFILQLGKRYPDGFMHIPYVLFEYLQKYGGDSICSNTSYEETARAFEKIYKKHKKDPLMAGQQWYPAKIIKYKKLQKEFEKGKIPPPSHRLFPRYWKT